MAVYTFTINSICSGGEHITIGLKKDGVQVKTMGVTRTDLRELDVTMQEAALLLMRQAIRDNNASTPAQIKSAIENIQVSL